MPARRSQKSQDRSRASGSSGKRGVRRPSRRASSLAKKPLSQNPWIRYMQQNFGRLYKEYRGGKEHLTVKQHREVFSRTMKALGKTYPGPRKSRRVPGAPRKPYSRKPYGSRGKYKPRASNASRKSGKPRRPRPSRKPRRAREVAEVDVGGLDLADVEMEGSARRRASGGRRRKKPSRKPSRKASGANASRSAASGLASLVAAPIRAAVSVPRAVLGGAEPPKAPSAAKKKRPRRPEPLGLIPELPPVGAEVGRRTRGATAAAAAAARPRTRGAAKKTPSRPPARRR